MTQLDCLRLLPSPRSKEVPQWARIILLFIVATGAWSGSACARSAAIFPPEVSDSVWWSSLENLEPPIWRPEDLKGLRSRVRFSISGISTLRAIIRIDEDMQGRFKGRVLFVKRTNRSGSSFEISQWNFRPSVEQMHRFAAKADAAKLWQIYPEHWRGGEDDICVDGEQIVFEKASSQGYRFSEANAQCTAPRALIDAAREFIDISGKPGLASLLE